LQAYTEHGLLSERPYERPPPPSDLPPRSDLEGFLSGSAPREPEVKALVAGYGAPIARERFCAEAGEAAVVAEAIGFPVALKAVCSDLVHKSDVGAVRLHLRDAAAVQRAWREIDGALRQHLPEARLEGCLVSEMVEAAVELIVGLKSDDQFGPMVLVGFGGVAVELAPDLALASAPVSPERARHMLTSLRQYPLLDGFRGRRKADIEAIADLVSRMSFLGDAAGSELAALDLNPVLVRSKDGLPVVVDARATLPGRHGRA
jgi:succinyl-CoA synthetase beta subunit